MKSAFLLGAYYVCSFGFSPRYSGVP